MCVSLCDFGLYVDPCIGHKCMNIDGLTLNLGLQFVTFEVCLRARGVYLYISVHL